MPDGPPRPPPVLLLWGDDAFLLRLATREFLQALDVRATEIEAGEWQGGELADLATPSLWGERRALVVANAARLPDAAARELAAYVQRPSPEAVLVLTLVTRGRNAPALAKAVQAGGGAARQVALKRQDLPRWVMDRARLRDARVSSAGAAALVGRLGEDPATLDQAVEQLVSAFAGAVIGPEEVTAQFEGLGEQQVWDLCDHAFSGRVPEALLVLRSLLASRADPLLILGGIASRLRDLIRVRALPARMGPGDAARAAGLRFEWQLRRYREQAGRYEPEELSELVARLADVDRAIKGGTPGDVALAALVMALAGEREAALEVPARPGR